MKKKVVIREKKPKFREVKKVSGGSDSGKGEVVVSVTGGEAGLAEAKVNFDTNKILGAGQNVREERVLEERTVNVGGSEGTQRRNQPEGPAVNYGGGVGLTEFYGARQNDEGERRNYASPESRITRRVGSGQQIQTTGGGEMRQVRAPTLETGIQQVHDDIELERMHEDELRRQQRRGRRKEGYEPAGAEQVKGVKRRSEMF